MDELISIIVPVYNVENYLDKCIESILNQTYNNTEILLIDDGSTDKSGNICDSYAHKYSRIKVIHKENGGLSDARNTGIKQATGAYLVFVDSDDYIEADMIENMYIKLIETDADVAVCNIDNVDENGNSIEKYKSPIKDEILNKTQALRKLVAGGSYWFYVTSVNRLYKKEIFNDLLFPVGKIHEDEFTAHYIFDRCEKIVCISKKTYKYLRHSGSITRNGENAKRTDAAEAFLDRLEFFCKKEMYTEAVKVALSVIEMWNIKYRKNKKMKNEIDNMCRKLIKLSISKKDKIKLAAFVLGNSVYKGLKYTFRIRAKLNRINTEKIFAKNVKKVRRKCGRCAFLVATPCHGNLGDHAIVTAEYKILEKCGFADSVIEISNNMYRIYKKVIKKYIMPEDLIVIDGGGNMGTLWPEEDDKISEIISTYKDNKIIVFPQTCYYDDTEDAQKRLKQNHKIYLEAKRLTISLRDKQSYEFCKENFEGVNIMCIPDIVLSIEGAGCERRREGCLLCFRTDLEKVVSDKENKRISDFLEIRDIKTGNISTVLSYDVNKTERKNKLSELFEKLSGAKLLITDRLHGMIFAAITGTPCLAIDNKSKKVSGVYKWISSLDYIKICDDTDEIINNIDAFYNKGGKKYDATILEKHFAKLKAIVENG